VIFALRRISETVTMAAQEIGAGAIEFRDEPAATATRAEEIGPPAAELARHPKDLCRLFNVPPLIPLPSDAVPQRELISTLSSRVFSG
jgi:hypothetical protein